MKYNYIDEIKNELDDIKKMAESCEENDAWFGIEREDGKIGADFNFWVDEGKYSGCIYGVFPNEYGDLSTDYEDYESYNVDFSDENWKDKLIDAMIDFCERRTC